METSSSFTSTLRFGIAVLLSVVLGPNAADSGAAGRPGIVAAAHPLVSVPPARPDLRVTGISHIATANSANQCSVIFRVTVKNFGTASAGSFVVGARGWGSPTIPTCTGTWRAINTTTPLAPNQSRTVIVYGPGFVGPRVLRGAWLSITAYADTHCAVAETTESDNGRTQMFHVGY